MIKTNDIKKGTRIRLANGWYATMMDNRKGNIRQALVEGVVTEQGSVYAHDIVQAYVPKFGTQKGEKEWQAVEHTPQQVKARDLNDALFAEHYNDNTGKEIL